MKFSYAWLRDFVELPALSGEVAADRATLLALADDLTSVGLAVEAHELLPGGDAWLDVEVTGNRPDCMNHRGIAREIAVRRGQSLHEPRIPAAVASSAPDVPRARIEVESAEECPRFTARIVRGVKVGPSPEWLVRRLEAIGSRSINNVVDATNFVLWETGQPLHAYDLATIPNGALRVRRASAGETIVTLDGKQRKLDGEVLVIADSTRPVGIAGIMGGLATEVTATTTDLLIEAAHFDRRRIRLGAKRLDMHTDASHRFERGADLEACDLASRRCAALIVEIAGGEVLPDAADVRAATPEPIRFRLAGGDVERFGGTEIPDAEIERILEGLGFSPRRVEGRAWEGSVPSWREVDFEPRRHRSTREAWPQDLYEEVLRQFGFDRVPATLPVIAGVDAGESPEHARRERLRDLLAGLGYSEAIHYAFGKREDDDALPKLAGEGAPLALANPLSELLSVMRRSLLPNLVSAAEFNANRGARGVRLFESGHLFPGGTSSEIEALALVAGGRSGDAWSGAPEADLFSLKGEVEALLEDLGARPSVVPAELPGIVAGTGGRFEIGGDVVGHFGRIAATQSAFPLFVAELRLDRLPLERARVRVVPPSRFPGIDVDFTLTHSLDVSWSEIASAISGLAVDGLAAFALKDRYQGGGVPAGSVATTIAFAYNAVDRSLTQDEVNERQGAVVAALESRFAMRRA